MLNQIATMLLAPLYPHYQRHRSHHPLSEMCGWMKRLAKRPFERRYAERLSGYLGAARPSYYLLPLQLETDYQIRRHSRFKSMAQVMQVVLESFARGAPANAHPGDQAAPAGQRHCEFPQAGEAGSRERLGFGERVLVMDGGHLPTLLCEEPGRRRRELDDGAVGASP